MNNDMRFLVECLTAELAEMLMKDYDWSMKYALDQLYASQTFAKLNDPDTGLYFQGSVYVYDFLKHEIETGKIA